MMHYFLVPSIEGLIYIEGLKIGNRPNFQRFYILASSDWIEYAH